MRRGKSKSTQHMYKEAKETRNPFVGCKHGCIYCVPSFQRQAKRRGKRCLSCYKFEPHFHEGRLGKPYKKLPPDCFVFLCDMGDISFAKPEWRMKIYEEVGRNPHLTFLIQSKNPRIFHVDFEKGLIPHNLLLGTTIETNRTSFNTPSKYRFYTEISKAPLPFERYRAMKELRYEKKSVTIEPILDFDIDTLTSWIQEIGPRIVYIGYDNHGCKLPEPPLWKVKELIGRLKNFAEVRYKTPERRGAWWENESAPKAFGGSP